MVKNRIQCSLVFQDDDLYKNFVLPLKAHHQFADFVVNLITQYYNNAKVRQAVDSVEGDNPLDRTAVADAFKEIHESLALMDYFVQEGKDITEDGKDTITDIMDRVQNSSNVTVYKNQQGSEFLRIEDKEDVSVMQEVVEGSSTVDNNQLIESMDNLTSSIEKFGSILVNNQVNIVQSTVQQQVEEEPIVKPQVEVIYDEKENKEEEGNQAIGEGNTENSLLSLLDSLG